MGEKRTLSHLSSYPLTFNSRVGARGEDFLLREVILPFQWAAGSDDNPHVERQILDAIRCGSYALDAEPEHIYEHLFAYVFRLLCLRQKPQLTIEGLWRELKAPTIDVANRGILMLVRKELTEMKQDISTVRTIVEHQGKVFEVLRQTVSMLSQALGINSFFAVGAISLSTEPPELVEPSVSRKSVVDDLFARIQNNQVVTISGEMGSVSALLLSCRATIRYPLLWKRLLEPFVSTCLGFLGRTCSSWWD